MTYRRLLLATDGSLAALAATMRAVQMARESGAELHAVHVTGAESALQVEFAESSLGLLHVRPVDGLEAARHLGRSAGVQVHTHQVRGPIVDGIVQAARRIDADIVIAGETGMRPLLQTGLGSVSEALQRRSGNIPLILVPGRAEEVIPVVRQVLQQDPAAVPGGASADSDVDWSHAVARPSFQALLSAKARFLVPAVVFYLVCYLGMTVLAGFAPDLMARPVFGAVNVGYLLILATYSMVWILAIVYVRVANKTFDPKVAATLEDLHPEEDQS